MPKHFNLTNIEKVFVRNKKLHVFLRLKYHFPDNQRNTIPLQFSISNIVMI